jgi:hypothetical protein
MNLMMVMRTLFILSPFRIIWMVFLRATILVLVSPFSRSVLSCCSEGTSKSDGTWIRVYDGISLNMDIREAGEPAELSGAEVGDVASERD